MTWTEKAELAALDMMDQFKDDMITQWRKYEQISDELCDYEEGENYHIETNLTNLNRSDVADVLHELDDWEETDSSLWDDLPDKDQDWTKAEWTFANAILGEWEFLVHELNLELEELEIDDEEEDEEEYIRQGTEVINNF